MDQAELMLLVEQQEGGQQKQRLLSMQEALHMMVGGLTDSRVLTTSIVTHQAMASGRSEAAARAGCALSSLCGSAVNR
jgi:hypothetical protein